jgi:hypothetical protein
MCRKHAVWWPNQNGCGGPSHRLWVMGGDSEVEGASTLDGSGVVRRAQKESGLELKTACVSPRWHRVRWRGSERQGAPAGESQSVCANNKRADGDQGKHLIVSEVNLTQSAASAQPRRHSHPNGLVKRTWTVLRQPSGVPPASEAGLSRCKSAQREPDEVASFRARRSVANSFVGRVSRERVGINAHAGAH